MKTVILSINSRYIHTLLAPRYLKANAVDKDIEIIETNITVNIQELFEQLYQKQPDILAISCYIFNIEFVRKLLDEIRLILPSVKIILGGYEAAFDTDRYFQLADYIIKGEGDLVFAQLLDDIENRQNKFSKIIEAGTVSDLSVIQSPYTAEYARLGKDRILYFETTRGCPYACSYCMSANTKGVRSFSAKWIEKNLRYLMSFSPKQIKFVDRTFNYDMNRAAGLFNFLIDNFSETSTNFHFEMSPELFNDDMFEALNKAKKGLFQFEIGIQSFNRQTLKAVGRSADIDRIDSNLTKLIKLKTITIHLDLIVGLPLEDLNSFAKGFDRLINYRPNCLQLGFLKVLKGSKLQAESTDIKTFKSPPYEVVQTPALSYGDILLLKGVEEMTELYYNSGRFNKSVDYILQSVQSPFAFFSQLAMFYKDRGLTKRNTQAKSQCDLLYSFVKLFIADKNLNISQLKELIGEDYNDSGNMRKWRFCQIN